MSPVRRTLSGASAAAAALVVLALVGLPGLGGAAPTHPTVAPLTTNSTVQWAYGGSASSNFSCSNLACAGYNLSLNNTTFSVSWKVSAQWVVIYTQTNVSVSQTEIATQAALGVAASYDIYECQNLTPSLPCQAISASLSLNGQADYTGHANLTTGSVVLTSTSGHPSVPAVAISNASSSKSLNFSGSFSLTDANISGTGSFDLGGSAVTSIAFGSPLGIVPTTLAPGDTWVGTAPYTASGNFTYGYSYAASASGQTPISVSSWNHTNVSPSGNLTVYGSDAGTATLYDNHTSPHNQYSTDRVALAFPNDQIVGSDGYVLGPSVAGGLSSFGGLSGNNSTEYLYYAPGSGFLGGNLSGNSSNLNVTHVGPALSLQAGPEPVGLAQQQYTAITSPSSPSAGFPYVWVAVAGVVVVGAIAGLVLLRRRGGPKKPMAAAAMPPAPPTPVLPPTGGAGGSP